MYTISACNRRMRLIYSIIDCGSIVNYIKPYKKVYNKIYILYINISS